MLSVVRRVRPSAMSRPHELPGADIADKLGEKVIWRPPLTNSLVSHWVFINNNNITRNRNIGLTTVVVQH